MDELGLMIGEFARHCRLPVSTLRYYDKIGLLTPTAVDPATGYRRYALDQLARAVLISRLRAAGIAPDRIGRIVAGGLAGSTALLAERRRIASGIACAQRRLCRLDQLLAGDGHQDYRVDLVELAPRRVAALPFLVALADLQTGIMRAIGRMRSVLRRGDYRRTGYWGATFPLELGEQVSGFVFTSTQRAVTGGGCHTAWLPAATAAIAVHPGSVESLPLAYHAAFTAIEMLGGSPAAPVIEEYPGLDDAGTDVAQRIRVHVPFHDDRDCVTAALES